MIPKAFVSRSFSCCICGDYCTLWWISVYLPPGEAKAEGLGGTDNSSHGYRSVWKEPEEHLHAGLVLPTVKSSTHPQGAVHCLSSIVLQNNTSSQTVKKQPDNSSTFTGLHSEEGRNPPKARPLKDLDLLTSSFAPKVHSGLIYWRTQVFHKLSLTTMSLATN